MTSTTTTTDGAAWNNIAILQEIKLRDAIQSNTTRELRDRAQPSYYRRVLSDSIDWDRVKSGVQEFPSGYAYETCDYLRFLKIKGIVSQNVEVDDDLNERCAVPTELHILYPWNVDPNGRLNKTPRFPTSEIKVLEWRLMYPTAWELFLRRQGQEQTDAQKKEAYREEFESWLLARELADHTAQDIKERIENAQRTMAEIQAKITANVSQIQATQNTVKQISERYEGLLQRLQAANGELASKWLRLQAATKEWKTHLESKPTQPIEDLVYRIRSGWLLE